MRTPVALELAAKNLLNRLLHLNTAQRNPSSEPYEIAIASSTAEREQSNGHADQRRRAPTVRPSTAFYVVDDASFSLPPASALLDGSPRPLTAGTTKAPIVETAMGIMTEPAAGATA